VCAPLLVGICVTLSCGAGAHTKSNGTHPSEHTRTHKSKCHTYKVIVCLELVCAPLSWFGICVTLSYGTLPFQYCSCPLYSIHFVISKCLWIFERLADYAGDSRTGAWGEASFRIKVDSEGMNSSVACKKKLIPNMRSYINWAEAMTFRSSLSVYLNFANSAWDQHLHDPTQNFKLNMTKKVSATCSYCFHYLLLFILTNLDILG